uniref:CopG domain protein DNA-binding domain protein n=1 Tax=Thermus sp. WG TaxID=1312524 RepID=R4JCL3_9DEIN|nr:ribbon-helix-helix domain-containing protein [Thermus sp. WG]AGK85232.1 CopG domain protein DNA-binding domain protein [Thermus sp. WG]
MSVLTRLEKRLRDKAKPRLEERLTLRLDPDTYRALEALAQEYSMTLSELAREALIMLAEEYRVKTARERTQEPPNEQPQGPSKEPSDTPPTLFPEAAQE